MVAGEAGRRQFVAMLAAALRDDAEAVADLDPLDGVQAHHREGDVGVEPVVQRFAQAHRHAVGAHLDARAAAVARLAQFVHVGLQPRHDAGVGRVERVQRDLRSILERDLDLAQLAHPAAERGAVLLLQPLARHRTGGHGGCRQPGRRTATAARIADAVLAPVGVVGMAGAEGVEQVAVVLAALVGVLDQQADRRAGGQAFVDARQDLDRIGLVALGHVAAGAGAAAVELGLDVFHAQRQAGRTAVDHAADGRAVAFAEIGDAKQVAEGAAGHGGGCPWRGARTRDGRRPPGRSEVANSRWAAAQTVLRRRWQAPAAGRRHPGTTPPSQKTIKTPSRPPYSGR